MFLGSKFVVVADVILASTIAGGSCMRVQAFVLSRMLLFSQLPLLEKHIRQ